MIMSRHPLSQGSSSVTSTGPRSRRGWLWLAGAIGAGVLAATPAMASASVAPAMAQPRAAQPQVAQQNLHEAAHSLLLRPSDVPTTPPELFEREIVPEPGDDPATPAQLPADAGDDWVMTEWGPLGPADRDIIVKIRQAGLWESPAGRMAMTQGGSEAVRKIGAMIATEHAKLDKMDLEAAEALGVLVPNDMSYNQSIWISQMTPLRGAAFDEVFTDRLRLAHGAVVVALAASRAGTQNTVVRNLVQATVDIVMGHLTYLESTGAVTWANVPVPPEPTPERAGFFARSGMQSMTAWVILAVTLGIGLLGFFRVARPRGN